MRGMEDGEAGGRVERMEQCDNGESGIGEDGGGRHMWLREEKRGGSW